MVFILIIILSFVINPLAESVKLSKEEALNVFRSKFNQIDKNNAQAYLELARFCLSQGLLERAQNMVNTALRIDPTIKEQAQDILSQLKNEEVENLLTEARKQYNLGFYAEAKSKVDAAVSRHPQSRYTTAANKILEEILAKTSDKPYLLRKVANNISEYRLLLKSFQQKAKEEGENLEEIKDDYYNDLLKKADYYAFTLPANQKDYQLSQQYLLYSLDCINWVLKSDDKDLKDKAKNKQSQIVKKLFSDYPVFSAENRRTFYKYLYLLKDKNLKDEICRQYYDRGFDYLKEAEKVSRSSKREKLKKALDYFYIAHDYADSKQLQDKAFGRLREIKNQMRNLR
jgi:hypothetical protein